MTRYAWEFHNFVYSILAHVWRYEISSILYTQYWHTCDAMRNPPSCILNTGLRVTLWEIHHLVILNTGPRMALWEIHHLVQRWCARSWDRPISRTVLCQRRSNSPKNFAQLCCRIMPPFQIRWGSKMISEFVKRYLKGSQHKIISPITCCVVNHGPHYINI